MPTATIKAQPGDLQFDTATTAVLVIDMQNDFGAEGGMFHRAGIDISIIQAVVPATARVMAAARACGMPVVYVKMAFKADMSDAGALHSANYLRHARMSAGMAVQAPDGRPSRILIRDTWNTDILPALAPQPGDTLVYKHRYSGFFETELHTILQQKGITDLIVTGCTTSICVDATIRDAMYRDYRCVLLQDCCAEPLAHSSARSNHEASLLAVQILLGWTSTSAQFMEALNAAATPANQAINQGA